MESSTILPRLNADFLKHHPDLAPEGLAEAFPERVIQFGAGVFLRGFVDWMIDGMNRKGLFCGRVVVVASVNPGTIATLNQQDGVYTHLARGIENGRLVEEKRIVTAISRGIDPCKDFDAYLTCTHNPHLRFIVSNTTEAGIVYRPEDRQSDRPPVSFPAKLTRFLLERYKAFDGDMSKGFVLLPCELVERNGDRLKETVLQTANNWNLEPNILQWIAEANIFTNTLVDRIVTGMPRDEIQTLWQQSGYIDELFNTSEVFHLWVIEGPRGLAQELPLGEAGFNVIFPEDLTPYRDRKVRILNGAHTTTVLAAYQAGQNLVGECMRDPLFRDFMTRVIYDEVIPTLMLPKQELETFAASVFERFSNPFIQHALLSISLNSVSKYKARVLPSIEQFLRTKEKLPIRLTFALAALITFYRGTEIRDGALIGRRGAEEYHIQDSQSVLEAFAGWWAEFDGTSEGILGLTDAVLRREDWWGEDLRQLPGMSETVAQYAESILNHGVRDTLQPLS
ncbi:MAG: tagaturonate reductase [Acidobacteriota bacterium]